MLCCVVVYLLLFFSIISVLFSVVVYLLLFFSIISVLFCVVVYLLLFFSFISVLFCVVVYLLLFFSIISVLFCAVVYLLLFFSNISVLFCVVVYLLLFLSIISVLFLCFTIVGVGQGRCPPAPLENQRFHGGALAGQNQERRQVHHAAPRRREHRLRPLQGRSHEKRHRCRLLSHQGNTQLRVGLGIGCNFMIDYRS